MTQPLQNRGHVENLLTRGQGGSVDHHNRQTQFARGKQLGLRARATGVFGNDTGDPMGAHQLQVSLNGERPAVCYHDVICEGQGGAWRIDEAQQVKVLRIRCEFLKVHTPDSQHDPFTRHIQRRDSRGYVGHIYPVVALLSTPRCARKRYQRILGRLARLNRIQAHLGGKGVRGVDQMCDLVVNDISGKAFGTVKAADALGKRMPDWACDTARQRKRALKSRIIQRLTQQSGLGCAAKDQGVWAHG